MISKASKMSRIVPFAGLFLFVLSLLGCSSVARQAAPIGETAVLEKLASAYTELSQGLTMSADRLPEKERKIFIVRVFEKAGYDYTATLKELVSGKYNIKLKSVRDMVELVTLPHRYLKWDDRVLERLYSSEEMGYIKRLHRMQR